MVLFPKLPWIVRQGEHKILLQHIAGDKGLGVAGGCVYDALVLMQQIQCRKFHLSPIAF